MSEKQKQVISAVANDPWIKIAGIDADGVLRGKDIANYKFVKAVQSSAGGIPMCSVLFGWDIEDELYYDASLPTSNIKFGYPDLLAKIDLHSYRRIPWENNMPLFLVSFHSPKTLEPLDLCPRNVIASQIFKARSQYGVEPLTGIEYEFFHYRADGNSPPSNHSPPQLSRGLFTYSLIRPAENIAYYQAIKDITHKLECPIDGLHTESGPVYEASLTYDSIDKIADRGPLFKYLIKCIAPQFDITPTFMAKPTSNMPGSSGHVHISLVDSKDRNKKIFDRQDRDTNARFPALEYVSDAGRSFLAGLLDGIPDILPLLCPTVNSYKRLGHRQHWTADTVSWGVDNRNASIRVIAGGASGGTRFECRVPGADANAPYVLAALVGCGLRGMERRLEVTSPPLEEVDEVASPGKSGGVNGETQGQKKGLRTLSRTLKEAVIDMTRHESVAREIFGDKFVEQFAATRMREVRCYEDVVTDWEVSRYLERV
ncbi:hypothetical protein KVR01_001938 [Diaporthe batatas]|uniref:uncharacterized protein n=1 Tax=Diaporthe batatas TaxID=748121 RepID=UPI001D0531FB|nr:uncharacterized protein KVR01_001938 [Diaporthe batatas]KAG8169189.1 hypothetical protein KVR01_001938 [Diaporthe batatas]